MKRKILMMQKRRVIAHLKSDIKTQQHIHQMMIVKLGNHHHMTRTMSG
jgi:hypothetical protein